MKNVFFIAGRTGGPFFPFPTIIKNLQGIRPIIVGVKNGFEVQAAQNMHLTLEYLPEVRLKILTFKRERISETIRNYLELLLAIWLFFICILKSFWLLLRYKPKMIYSTGSFLAVPMILASKISNLFRLTQVKIVIHQQDPLPGLSNRFTIQYADLKSCVFEYTKQKFDKFAGCELIPNPIDADIYTSLSEEERTQIFTKYPDLADFIQNSDQNKPILMIFGGGSGSEDINVWTMKYIHGLLQEFRVLHLTGVLQNKELLEIEDINYFRKTAIFQGWEKVLQLSDLVLCRAGMGSITELLYLQKPAFLVPLPSTHQEINAKMVQDYFYILHQKDRPDWLQTILQNYPNYFNNLQYPEQETVQIKLKKYYQQMQEILDKN